MSTTKEVALASDKGTLTPFGFVPQGFSDSEIDAFRGKVEAAKKADQKTSFRDVAPLYWEAKRGEEKILVLLGFKPINKTDEKTGEVVPDFAVVFHDGEREVVMSQISIKDAMKSRKTGDTFRIVCTESAAGKAKKFDVFQHID